MESIGSCGAERAGCNQRCLAHEGTAIATPRMTTDTGPSGRSCSGGRNRIPPQSRPRIVVDGVIFQYQSSGIARVWVALLEEWAKSGFIDRVVLLDRGGRGVPQIPGLRGEKFVLHDYGRTGADSLALERICREFDADLFVSTYYTTPTATSSFFFGHDMIPEIIGADLSQEVWREKRRAILHAAARLMVSENSARDLERIYGLPRGSTHVAHNGVWRSFYFSSYRDHRALHSFPTRRSS